MTVEPTSRDSQAPTSGPSSKLPLTTKFSPTNSAPAFRTGRGLAQDTETRNKPPSSELIRVGQQERPEDDIANLPRYKRHQPRSDKLPACRLPVQPTSWQLVATVLPKRARPFSP